MAVVTTSSSLSGDDLLSAGRPDFKGIRTYHISGTCGDASISRITCGRMGCDVAGNLREVGRYFLRSCINIKSIDLTPLRAVEVLPEYFLSGCSGLEEVDLSPLINLREVGRFFLVSCTGMKSIDLTPLRAVQVLPDGFLNYCSGLEAVDLSPPNPFSRCGSCMLHEPQSYQIGTPSAHQPVTKLHP